MILFIYLFYWWKTEQRNYLWQVQMASGDERNLERVWVIFTSLIFLRFFHKSELSPSLCGLRTDPWKTQWSPRIWPLLLCTFLSVFYYKPESSESSMKVVLSKTGAANRPTEVEKDRHSGLWNLSSPLSELCMSLEKQTLYSLDVAVKVTRRPCTVGKTVRQCGVLTVTCA